ncbi:hypothetical protein CASFOL_014945 [Castilleja foliolosa]|uniref:Bromo domain-containing protein n=1 Tax=Castilleja foliolosa TaxID=1961234 RepID=A0ABD3DGC0_9LAMI
MEQIVKRKKKGRPPKSDLLARKPPPQTEGRDLRRSHRRRNVKYVFDLDDYYDEDELFEDDEDHRRREKKLKLLLKLESESNTPEETRYRRVNHAPTTSTSSSDDEGKPAKKRKIDGYLKEDVGDKEDNYTDEEEEEGRGETKQKPIAEISHPGTPVKALPLPDKKVLELILDKLQKKDIYGVYAEPVDPEELPDYHDIIEHPMDFATVRSKLGNGSYATLEQFESDVFLICSNAMQYNSSVTVYHKQARTIRDLAKRKFEKVRLRAYHTEKEIKTEQKSGSVLKKQIIRSVSRTPQEPVGSDFSSGATLAYARDNQNLANAFQAVGSEKPGNIVEGLVDANLYFNDNNLDKTEDSLPGKDVLSRFGRKPFVHDENDRATYTISQSHPVLSSDSIFSTFDGETKHLVPVGLYSDHSYARSLARFAATLGSVAWEVASKRIEQALPQGLKFGQGWVGEYEPLPTPVLMLENRSIKEPPFMAKVQPPPPVPKKLEKRIVANSRTESQTNVHLSENKLPFFIPTQPIQRNNNNNIISEMNPSSYLSPRVNPNNGSHNLNYQHQNLSSRVNPNNGSHNLNYQHQKLTPRAIVETAKKTTKNAQSNSPDHVSNRQISRISEIEPSRQPVQLSPKNVNFSPSRPFKQSDSNGVAFQDGKVVGKPNQGQGLSDPVQLMRHLAEKAHTKQKTDPSHQVMPSAPNFSDSNNAALAAARTWMSVGSGGFRSPIVAENGNKNNHQIYADSLYNSTRDMQQPQQMSRFHGSGLQQNGFVPQGLVPMMMQQFQNQRMGFAQLANADLSRLQLQSTWRGNMNPQMHSRQRQPESLPPDLNIRFQSSGSPGRPTSGVLVDSQQPDLALQL